MSVYTNFKNFTDTELEQEDYRFNLEISNAELADDAWQELNSFFVQHPDLKDKYRYSYWRWFVILSCQKALSSSDATFLRLIEEQIPVAILVNIDILEVMMRYLAQNYYSREDIGGYFIKLQSAFLKSKAVVGVWQGKNVAMDELVKEIDLVYRSGDSLKRADFESRLQQIMFSDEMAKKYFTADPERAKEEFLDLVSFFETFTQENIWYVVDAFLNPGKYQNVVPGEAAPAAIATPRPAIVNPAPQPQAVLPKKEAKPRTEPSNGSGTGETKMETIASGGIVPISKIADPVRYGTTSADANRPPRNDIKPSPAQIKSQIEKEFSAEDAEGIMGKLNELAEKNNDSKIAEMYYFDESSGKFKWSI